MSRTKLMFGFALLAALAMFSFGCSSAVDDAPKFDAQTGEHPKGWIHGHGSDFLVKPDECVTCHGSYREAANAGGISKVSCFSCHRNGVTHESGFADRLKHGRGAAQRDPEHGGPTPMVGFLSCKKCHGDDYRGRGMAKSCIGCHFNENAPHPKSPWTGSGWTDFQVATHAQTREGNAAACYECHANGKNSTRKPAAPPATGATPGCYNNTLCHAYDMAI